MGSLSVGIISHVLSLCIVLDELESSKGIKENGIKMIRKLENNGRRHLKLNANSGSGEYKQKQVVKENILQQLKPEGILKGQCMECTTRLANIPLSPSIKK